MVNEPKPSMAPREEGEGTSYLAGIDAPLGDAGTEHVGGDQPPVRPRALILPKSLDAGTLQISGELCCRRGGWREKKGEKGQPARAEA